MKITDWTKKWRMKLNIEKIEFCLFNRKMGNEISSITIKMDGKEVKRTDSPKLLGVILDKKLSFQKHIDAIERKATKAAASLAIVGRSEQISAENMLKLYKSIVPGIQSRLPCTPRTIFHGRQIVHWDPLDAKRRCPQKKLVWAM